MYTFTQCWEILSLYFENHCVAECVRKLRADFGWRKAPLALYVKKLNIHICGIENPHDAPKTKKFFVRVLAQGHFALKMSKKWLLHYWVKLNPFSFCSKKLKSRIFAILDFERTYHTIKKMFVSSLYSQWAKNH